MRRSLLQRLREAGRVLSKANETKLKDAASKLNDVLASVAKGMPVNEAQRAQLSEITTVLVEAELSHEQQRSAVQKALRAATATYCYIREMYDTWLVYDCYDSQVETDRLYKVSYVIDADSGAVTFGSPVEVMARMVYEPVASMQEGAVTFGSPVEVMARMVYEPVASMQEGAAPLVSDCIPLVEKAVRRDGTVPIKVIAPGWGSSGYYGAEMLERDGPTVFAKGTHMYWNHPTASEEVERPERDLRDLAAVLESDARWEADGVDGPGLYADARVMPTFANDVEALAEHIGTSIRASGKAHMGEAEGRQGVIIESIIAADSIDFVTKPGAGGKVLQLFESAGRRAVSVPTPSTSEEEPLVNEQEAQALRESQTSLQTENARLKEALLLREAKDIVAARLATIDMSDLTRARLCESLSKQPVMVDGAIDKAAYETKIDEAAAAELEYLQKATGAGNGQISGMGGSTPADDADLSGIEASLTESFAALGLSESASKIAANGRV